MPCDLPLLHGLLMSEYRSRYARLPRIHRWFSRCSLALLAGWSLSISAALAEPKPVDPVLLDQLLSVYSVQELRWSDDGRYLAAQIGDLTGEKKRTGLWLYEAQGGALRPLTNAGQHNTHPRWSATGELAFLSDRAGGRAQLHGLSMRGGESMQWTRGEPVRDFAWSPDGKFIAYLAAEPAPAKAAWASDATVVGHAPARLWLLEVATGMVRQVSQAPWRLSQLAWFPDGQRLLVAATNDPNDEFYTDRMFSLDLTSGDLQEVGRPQEGPFTRLQLSPDGRWFSYVGSVGGGPIPHDLFVQAVAGGEPRNLTRASLDRQIMQYAWRSKDSVLARVAAGMGDELVQVDLTGRVKRERSTPGQSIPAFAAVGDQVAWARSTMTTPHEIWVGDRQVSHLHRSGRALVEPEIIQYTSFDGLTIEGAVYRPPGASADTASPMVVFVHGGPAGRISHEVYPRAQIMAARGYAVFTPNIRGSDTYGLSFLQANRADWGGKDFRDLMAGVDHLIEKGVADGERLGIGGWSFGGQMSASAVTQTHRFKAAVSGAPVSDLASEYGTESPNAVYDRWYFGTPYENPEVFHANSPVNFVSRVKTPVLILHGEQDSVNPIGQAQQLYRGLRHYGVATELVVYPREDHGFTEKAHWVDMLNRHAAWFDKYIMELAK